MFRKVMRIGCAGASVVGLSFLITMPAVGEGYRLALSPQRMSGTERIISIDVKVVSGGFRALAGIPMGWTFQLDDDASWNTHLTGDASLASAALFWKDSGSLTFCLEKLELKGADRFSVSGSLSVSTDFVRTRLIKLTEKDFKKDSSISCPK